MKITFTKTSGSVELQSLDHHDVFKITDNACWCIFLGFTSLEGHESKRVVVAVNEHLELCYFEPKRKVLRVGAVSSVAVEVS